MLLDPDYLPQGIASSRWEFRCSLRINANTIHLKGIHRGHGKEADRGPRGGKTTVTKSGLIRTVVYLHPDERDALRRAAFEVMREAPRRRLGLGH